MVTNYGGGGATKREGGSSEVLPLGKGGGGGKSLSHAEGGGDTKRGGTKSFEVVLIRELEVLAIVMGGAKRFHLLKGFRTRDFPIL